MAVSLDIALLNNDLLFVSGDIATGQSDDQHVADTINAFPGWWKETPADGVGIRQYLNSTGKEQEIKRAIKIQLQSDGYQADLQVYFDTDGHLQIIPNATKL